MRLTFIAASLALLPMASLAGPQDEAQAVFEKFLADFSSGNADVIAANFAPEALFWGTNSRDLISGSDAIRQYFVGAFKRLPGARATPVGKVSVVPVTQNVMAVAGVWQNERIVDGKTIVTQARNSVTLVKRDGRWLIISFANSPRPQSR